jgi:hypothetical protein
MVRYRPLGDVPQDRRLDRLVPDDWAHVEKWPLTAAAIPSKPVPVTIGVNWYSNFDNPQQDSRGRWWIGKGNLGQHQGRALRLSSSREIHPTVRPCRILWAGGTSTTSCSRASAWARA